MDAIAGVIAGWRKAGLQLNPPATPESLARLQDHLGTPLPEDVIAYFFTVDGMQETETGEWLSNFWSIEKIFSQRLEREGRDAAGPYRELAFADVMIHSWFLWFRIRPPRKFSVFVEEGSGEQPSLEAAFERYVAFSKGWEWSGRTAE